MTETPEILDPKPIEEDPYKTLNEQIKKLLDAHNISTATIIYDPADGSDAHMLQYGHFYDNAKLMWTAMHQVKKIITKDIFG